MDDWIAILPIKVHVVKRHGDAVVNTVLQQAGSRFELVD